MISFPNAKINLGLDIIARRSDGYHELQSVMIPVGWRDILEVIPARGLSTTLTVSGRKVDCPSDKNLVMKAYKIMSENITLPPVDIYLHKVIPDGAGLGGGSSDAAFMLKMLNEMFSLDFSKEHLAQMAAMIGADCPFFIYNEPMSVRGIGTLMEPLEVNLSGKYIVIVKPPVSVATAEAYRGVGLTSPLLSPATIISGNEVSDWGVMGLKNDFENTVFAIYPSLSQIKQSLADAGASYCAMSGSGSAIFGIFNSDILAENAAAVFVGLDVYCGKLGKF